MNLNIKQILSTNFNLTLEEILNIFYNKFVIIKATVTYKGHSTLKCLFQYDKVTISLIEKFTDQVSTRSIPFVGSILAF